jgi:hypothetical protein
VPVRCVMGTSSVYSRNDTFLAPNTPSPRSHSRVTCELCPGALWLAVARAVGGANTYVLFIRLWQPLLLTSLLLPLF